MCVCLTVCVCVCVVVCHVWRGAARSRRRPPPARSHSLLHPPPLQLELDEEEDGPVVDWFYDHQPLKYSKLVNGPSYRRWKLPLPVMSVLYRWGLR